MRSTKSLFWVVAFLVAAFLLTPPLASATTYTYTDLTADPTTQICTSPGNCFVVIQAFAPLFGGPGPILVKGDVVNLNVTFTTPFTVDGATGQSAIFGALIDTNYFNCNGAPVCSTPETLDSATSTETVIGENSGGPALTTGVNFTNPGFYSAVAFVNGPNGGFTVTGFDATFTIVNGDPFPLEAVAVESAAVDAPTVPEPATFSMLGLGFGLVGFSILRRRQTAWATPGKRVQ